MKLLRNPFVLVLLLLSITVAAYLFFKQLIIKKVMGASTNSNVKAFLLMIRKCEGTAGENGYRTLFGGKLFTDFSKHPNVKVPFSNTYSTAAGAYQFLYSTWVRIAATLNLKDFSPANQDLGAIELIREKNALLDVEQGRVQDAIRKVSKVWASLPGAGYGQPEKSLTVAVSYYTAAGGKFTA